MIEITAEIRALIDKAASASGRLRSSARLLKNGSAAWSVSNAERHRVCKTVICTTTHFPMTTAKIP